MFQQTMIIGNLGKDPEMRYTQDGTPVTDFTVAVSRRHKDRNGQMQEETTWFKVTCWRELAQTVYQYLKKGRQVMVIGDIKASAYIGQDGQPRVSLELTAREVKFLGNREDGGANANSGGVNAPAGNFAPQTDEELPF